MTDDKNERKSFRECSKRFNLRHHEPKWELSEQGEKSRQEWRARRTKEQHFSNCMLAMRRMFKEIVVILNLQDPNYEIDDDEVERLLQLAGWNEMRTERALKRLMEKIDA